MKRIRKECEQPQQNSDDTLERYHNNEEGTFLLLPTITLTNCSNMATTKRRRVRGK
jgi:hypothetical protein